ncbi:hypothetical protein BDDG_06814, partial [Blastomyces dermatitidis ATCC 18188]
YQLSMPEHFRIGMLWQWEPLYFGYSTRKRIDSVFISHARFMVLMTIEWLLHHRFSMSDSVLPITLFRSDGLDILVRILVTTNYNQQRDVSLKHLLHH